MGLVSAPEVQRKGIFWFNVASPLSLAELRGRLVILSFWTSCCVNCLNTFPVLKRLEELFGDKVSVIGVHSPKYPAEQSQESVRNAIARNEIHHPVAHDPELSLWHAYGVDGWPTLVFIDPCGKVLGNLLGEPDEAKLIEGVQQMLSAWQLRCPTSPVKFPKVSKLVAPNPTKRDGGRFRFPARIKSFKCAQHGRRWAIADSGHHQVVICDSEGREQCRFGSGTAGLVDGSGCSAAFHSPQGLACDDTMIYVADTGNHAIRSIDLISGLVNTVAGTGTRGSLLHGPVSAREANLASVWDVEIAPSGLVFANTGTHQLGLVDLSQDTVTCLAGTGTEDMLDGVADTAQLAQPAGLAYCFRRNVLFFVDSETSSVRILHLGSSPRVETLVGGGLFEAGLRNGDFDRARLQHCRGVACWGDRLLVADSYNGLLRVLDLQSRRVSALAGNDCRWDDGDRLQGGEPSGVAVDGDRILVADTNHHRIVQVLPGNPSHAHVWAR